MSLIDRRTFLGELGLGAAALTETRRAAAAVEDQRPNVILILADDLGWGDLSCYGQKKIATPHIDHLAAEGMRFTNCYSGSPVCGPSRSCLMTGQHTGHTRVRGNNAFAGGIVHGRTRRMHLTDEDVTVGHVLRKAGYRTCLVGKWHLEGYNPNAMPLDRGFDEFYGWQMTAPETHAPVYYPARRFINRDIIDVKGNENGARGTYETDLCAQHAIDFIRKNAGSRFFLFLSPTAPHDPLVPPPDLGKYGLEPWEEAFRIYAAMVSHLDKAVGQVMRLLQDLKIDEKTVVFFASDNGPRSGPREELTRVAEFFDSNGPFRGYKRDMYEGGIRVPMIARWPGRIPKFEISAAPWYFPDFVPTVAELAGGELPPAVDGVSVAPILLGRAGQPPERFMYWEFFERGFEQAVRWRNWKAVRHQPGGPLELYNLARDQPEEHDVAGAEPEVVARIEEYLKTARTDSPEFPVNHPARAAL